MIIKDDQAILVIGDIMRDEYTIGAVERICPEAPVPVVRHLETTHNLGGAANVAANISTLGGKARLLGLVGDDREGQAVAELLIGPYGRHHIRNRLLKCYHLRTTNKTRVVDEQGKILLRIDRDMGILKDADTQLFGILMRDDFLAGVSKVVVSDYGKGAITPSFFRMLLGETSKKKIPVYVDTKKADFEQFAGASLIKPNHETALAALAPLSFCRPGPGDRHACEVMAGVLAERFRTNIVITHGKHGCTTARPGHHPMHWPGIPVEGRPDVTGAGDTFMAALALLTSSGLEIEAAASRAAVAAHLAVVQKHTARVNEFEFVEKVRSSAGNPDVKVLEQDEAAYLCKVWREAGKKIVFTNGCFDLLHAGHLHLLRKARDQGDRLVVALNSDESVRALKGEGRPVQKDLERMKIYEWPFVDLVVFFDEVTPEKLVRSLNPHVIVKGEDYRGKQVAGADYIASRGGKLVLVPLLPGISTTALVKAETPVNT